MEQVCHGTRSHMHSIAVHTNWLIVGFEDDDDLSFIRTVYFLPRLVVPIESGLAPSHLLSFRELRAHSLSLVLLHFLT